MTKVVLNNIATLSAAIANINSNSAAIETAIENTLSRDGTTPNSMGADLDMDSHRIMNLASPASANDPVRLQDMVDAIDGVTLEFPADADSVTFNPVGTVSSTNVQTAIAEVSSDVTTLSSSVAALQSDVDDLIEGGSLGKILNTNRQLKYLPKGSSFITSGGVTQYVNSTAIPYVHGPGTGGSCAGTASIEASTVADNLAGRNFLRVNWTGAPVNSEGRPTYPTYFTNCNLYMPGASANAGKNIVLSGRVRTNFSAGVNIISYYEDGLGAGGTARFVFGDKILVPAGGAWLTVSKTFSPAAAAFIPTTSAQDIFSTGFGIEVAEFSSLTLPGRIDYSFDAVDTTATSSLTTVEEEANIASNRVRLLGRGACGYALSTTSVRMGFDFGGRPMTASPGIYTQGGATVFQGSSSFTASSPTILAATVVNVYGAVVDIGGFTGLTAGAAVVGAGDFIIAEST